MCLTLPSLRKVTSLLPLEPALTHEKIMNKSLHEILLTLFSYSVNSSHIPMTIGPTRLGCKDKAGECDESGGRGRGEGEIDM